MNYIKHQTALFERFAVDERIKAYHICLYWALFQVWNKNRFRNPFPITREEIMFLARIGSTNTYAKCMKELQLWGYITYRGSGNLHTGWKVSCIRFDSGTATGSDTGSDTGTATGTDTRTATGSATVYKNTNITNTIKGNKQGSPQNFKKNGRKKTSGRSNPLHVETDKDYSEPL